MNSYIFHSYLAGILAWIATREHGSYPELIFLTISPALFFLYVYASNGVTTTSRARNHIEIMHTQRLLNILLLMLLIASADLTIKIYSIYKEMGAISLVYIRSEQLSGENFRSTIGRIAGLAFIPYILLTASTYISHKKFSALIFMLIISFIYSTLMTGKGHVVMAAIVSIGALLKTQRYKHAAIMASSAIMLMLAIQFFREDTKFLENIFVFVDYFVQPWEGLWLLLNQEITPIHWLPPGEQPILESHVFKWQETNANVFTGFGLIIYKYGWIAGALYFFTLASAFKILSLLTSKYHLTAHYTSLLIFLYFAYFMFIDLFIFYNSFIFAVAVGVALAILEHRAIKGKPLKLQHLKRHHVKKHDIHLQNNS